MKNFKTAASILGGIVLGAGAVQMLHAQSTPASITVSEISVTDQEAYKAWLPDVQKSIKAAGGEYLAGGFNKATAITGAPPANRVVVIQYPSLDAVKTWWKDHGEADIKKAEKFASFRIYTVEATEKK